MIPTPTFYLRFIERDEVVGREVGCVVTKKVRVLQQFWAHPDGKECAGDIFRAENGTWRDVPLRTLTPAERKAVAETLRTWAAWCEADPKHGWLRAYFDCPGSTAAAFEAQFPAQAFCWTADESGWHTGPTAATGLLLAAAMVEAGDGV